MYKNYTHGFGISEDHREKRVLPWLFSKSNYTLLGKTY